MRRRLPPLAAVLLLALAASTAASAAPDKRIAWAKPQIARVVRAGFMARSVASFRPQDSLTEAELEQIVAGLDERLTPPAPPPEPVLTDPAVTDPTATDPTATQADPVPPPDPLPAPAPPWPLFHWRAPTPARNVTVSEFDRVLVGALGLADAARHIRGVLLQAGLHPAGRTGTETVARLIGLRLNHPAKDDDLELLPNQPITRAEAAYSLDRALSFDADAHDFVEQAAAGFTVPQLDDWQTRILTRAIAYVGFPYVWGGTSPGPEQPFGVPAVGGFDCSGFVWRVYKLTAYGGERSLASVLGGRTTFEMSGEVGRRDRIYETRNLKPGDVLFFGHGPKSKPSEVDHAAIYLGNGWMVQSSGNGVTIAPFDGWYLRSFAWARRPLREAGLDR